jgi:hypothetical protein
MAEEDVSRRSTAISRDPIANTIGIFYVVLQKPAAKPLQDYYDIMKNCAKLLALCASLSTASAFVVKSLPHQPTTALRSTAAEETTNWNLPSFAGPGGLVRVEGQSRRTFDFSDITQEVIQLGVTSTGRPMNAEMEVWIGPDWTPYKLKCYSEDGRDFPVQALIGTRNKVAQLEVRNTGGQEYPITAACSYATDDLCEARAKIPEFSEARMVQGGAVYTVPVDGSKSQVRVMLNSDTRQLDARVELLNGPNNVKQVFEVFTNNGVLNSMYVVFDFPQGSGYTVRVVNQATIEFPAYAYISGI